MSRSANQGTLCIATFWSLLALGGCDTTPTLVSELENSLTDAGDVDSGTDADVTGTDASSELCGNTVLDPGEICDPGIDFCCNSLCNGPIPAGIVCRPAFDACDIAEVCEGEITCPADEVSPEVCGDGIICGIEACDDGIIPPEDFDGCNSGCFVEPGFVCSGQPSDCILDPITSTSLDDAPFLPTGVNDFSIGGDTIPLFVDNTFDGGGWILVGRGREGWAWNDVGAGAPAAVKDGLGTTSAFTPTYLSAALIQELIDNTVSTSDLTQVDIRIRRAAAVDGSSYQEAIWIPLSPIGWTWIFDGGGPIDAPQAPFGFDVDLFVPDSAVGLGNFLLAANTEDTIVPIASAGPDDHTRIFTWASSEHGFAQGFAYGSSVSIGDGSPTNFLLNSGFDHSMPYTEIYIRGIPPQLPLIHWPRAASRFMQSFFAISTSQDQSF